MRKYILLITFLAVSFVALPGSVLAASCSAGPPACPGGSFCIPNPLKYESFECLVDAIASFFLNLAMVLAPLMVLIGAFTLMTAAGDPAKVKKANNIFIYTAVGFFIVLMSKGLVSAINALMGT